MNDAFDKLLGNVPLYDDCPYYPEDPSAPKMQVEADGEWLHIDDVRAALAGVEIQHP